MYRALPAWQARIAAAHTLPRELRANREAPFHPEQASEADRAHPACWSAETAPTTIKANPETVAAALPDARITVLDGQQHIAIDLVPEVFAEHLVAFLRDQS